jgi:WS/DGAT/MGAT family acyltransferase
MDTRQDRAAAPLGTDLVARIDRASPADLAALALQAGGGVPAQFGAVLVLDGATGFDLEPARRDLVARIERVPRLRQRLTRLGPGLGRPIWVDDPHFEPGRHVRAVRCPDPGDERELLAVAADVVVTPLPLSRPPWSATFVTGLTGGRTAVVLVMHHVVADGVGGLAILDRLLADPGTSARRPDRRFPWPGPGRRALVLDAGTTVLHALAGLPRWWRELRRSASAQGGLRALRAGDCSILRPTGPRRRLAVVRADLDAVRATAHQHGATVNDVLLVAVAAALHTFLAGRGEHLDTVRIAVMVGSRRAGDTDATGNGAAPLLVAVPGTGSLPDRLARTVGLVRAARAAAAGRPVVALLQPLFRRAAALGLYRFYLSRQHRMHTLVSNVRGPGRRLHLGAATVLDLIPISVAEAGDVAVQFVAASYAGVLTVTVVADPVHLPDLQALVTALQDELG